MAPSNSSAGSSEASSRKRGPYDREYKSLPPLAQQIRLEQIEKKARQLDALFVHGGQKAVYKKANEFAKELTDGLIGDVKPKDIQNAAMKIRNARSNGKTLPRPAKKARTTATAKGKVGRPKGSTKQASKDALKRKEEALVFVTNALKDTQENTTGLRVEKGKLAELIADAAAKYNIDEGEIKAKTVRNRLHNNLLEPLNGRKGPLPVLHELEDTFVAIIVSLADCNDPYWRGKALAYIPYHTIPIHSLTG